jgi:hypothetical protein
MENSYILTFEFGRSTRVVWQHQKVRICRQQLEHVMVFWISPEGNISDTILQHQASFSKSSEAVKVMGNKGFGIAVIIFRKRETSRFQCLVASPILEIPKSLIIAG